ncbi:MAG: transglycosylase SLT domain-containing protein [Cystobacter sp.]
MSVNDILFRYQPSGASEATAAQSRKLKKDKTVGVAASQALALEDLPRLKPYAPLFLSAGKKHDLPPALLAAIASRESRGGSALSSDGWGDNHNGFGLMQVDKNSHTPAGGPRSLAHLEQATRILKDSVQAVARKHSDWSAEQKLRGGVAAYNVGVGNVRTLAGMDRGTTGDDYSSDVWARARCLAPNFGGGAGGAVAASSPPPVTTTAPKAKATSPGAAAQGEPVVHALQLWLVRHGYMTGDEVKTGPGILGPKTRAAVAHFLGDRPEPSTSSPATSPSTPPAPSTPAPSTPVSSPGGSVLAEGVSLNLQDPILLKLATGTLHTGKNHSCVRTTLNNMARLGVRDIPAATGGDKNNSRGGMVQMLATKKWESLPFAGSQLQTIRSTYGTVSAHVISGAAYKKIALAGRVPSGAIIFQTKHGWDYGEGASGNDMGIVRDQGRETFNYASMPPIVYGKSTKAVVLLVPRSALVRAPRS